MIRLIDTHLHLDAQDFDVDREEVVKRAVEAGVTKLVTIGAGYGVESAQRAVALAEKYDFVWASVGIHPHDSGKVDDISQIIKLAQHPRVVAIGETGLDFYRDWAPREAQLTRFKEQIELAKQVKKPLIIHSRQAGEDCIKVLSENGAAAVGGVFHCYSEDEKFAERLRAINFIVSIPGSLTFKKSDQFREIVGKIPLEMIMLETDAPFLAPEPYRGKRCESAHMLKTAEVLARVKNLPLEEIAQVTSANAEKFYRI